MTNENKIHPILDENVEIKLICIKDVHRDINKLEAELKFLKQQVIEEYFSVHPIYWNNIGQELATYKPVVSNCFQQSRFKQEHQDLYLHYTEEKTSYKFLIK